MTGSHAEVGTWKGDRRQKTRLLGIMSTFFSVGGPAGVFRRLTEISEGRGYASARIISQEPLDRLTCGNFCRVASSLLPTIGQLSMHVGDP